MNMCHKLSIATLMSLFLQCSQVIAESWRGVTDSENYTWARALFVNDSEIDSNWTIFGCRTAVNSQQDLAQVDSARNWDGVVDAGSYEYVWIYGKSLGHISVANADGGSSSFYESFTLGAVDDGELTITIGSDGALSVSINSTSHYERPVISGVLPE